MNVVADSSNKKVDIRYSVKRSDFALDVDLNIPMQGITGIYGESGSGKTTLLRCIAGLETGGIGRLVVGGDVWQDRAAGISRPIHEREIAYVFQEPRLFRHLDVRRNLEYGSRRTKNTQGSISFEQIVALFELDRLLERKAVDLSGGEAQRVAIARALLRAPRLVLMDEPLAALDRVRKDEILPFLDRVHNELKFPIIYVSHNIEEICRLCDHLLVIEDGRIIAEGDLQSVLVRLDLPLLSGDEAGSVILGNVDSYDDEYDLTRLNFSGGQLLVPGYVGTKDAALRLRIKANDISLCRKRSDPSTILNILPALVEEVRAETSAMLLVRLKIGSDRMIARITRRSRDHLALLEGDDVLAQIKAVAIRNSPTA